MTAFSTIVRAFAVAMVAAGGCHAFLGLSADRILDAGLPVSILKLASLDSQNRFYGAMFGVAGAVLWVAAGNLERYDTILRILLCGGVLAGVLRLVSIAWVGWPSPLVIALMVIELCGTPLLLVWYAHVRKARR